MILEAEIPPSRDYVPSVEDDARQEYLSDLTYAKDKLRMFIDDNMTTTDPRDAIESFVNISQTLAREKSYNGVDYRLAVIEDAIQKNAQIISQHSELIRKLFDQ